ncbi:MAG: acylneuraminate cytidylyltransferase family protein [Pseudomonadota bacterium]
MNARAFIFARGGSKGVPGKNIRVLAGTPLIAHSIDVALASPSLGAVTVSTDDAEIAAIARAHGALVPFLRPAELASDTAGEWGAWQHAIRWSEATDGPFDAFVSLPATSPFRSVDDVEACLAVLRADPAADVVATVKAADRSPYFNMVTIGADGAARLVIAPTGDVVRRQDAPAVWDMTTVAYAARPAFVLRHAGLFDGRLRVVEVPAERALDIDTEFDFALAECIAERGLATGRI